MLEDREDCLHLHFLVNENDPIGFAYCPTCDNKVPLSMAINNLMDEVRKVLKSQPNIFDLMFGG